MRMLSAAKMLHVRELSYPVPPDKAFDALRAERRAVHADAVRRKDVVRPGVVLSCPARQGSFDLLRAERRAVHADAIRRKKGG